MILTGLHPDVVLEIATRSISYYVYQLGYENQIKGNIIKKVKRQNDEIKNYCYKINKKYKYDLLQMENSRKSKYYFPFIQQFFNNNFQLSK